MPQNRESTLADLITPFTEGAAQYLALPLLEKNRKRAQWGAGLLTWCAYTANHFQSAAGVGPSDFVRAVPRLPDAPQEVWVPLAIWAGAAVLGLLWLFVGTRGLRGAPRDVMSAIWAVVLGGVFTAALWYEWYLPREWVLLNFLLQGSYWAMIAAQLVKFWLAVRSPTGSGKAARMVKRAIERQAVKWRTGTRRQF